MKEVKTKHEIFGEISGQSANQLYKRYSIWAEENGKTKMNFTDWLDWAKKRGMIENKEKTIKAEGEEDVQDEGQEPGEEQKPISEKVKSNTGRTVVFWLAVAAVIGITIGLAKRK